MSSPVESTPVAPSSTADFLRRCARAPDRFFYPCNAKHRAPRTCTYQLRPRRHRADSEASSEAGSEAGSEGGAGLVSVRIEECAYTEGTRLTQNPPSPGPCVSLMLTSPRPY